MAERKRRSSVKDRKVWVECMGGSQIARGLTETVGVSSMLQGLGNEM